MFLFAGKQQVIIHNKNSYRLFFDIFKEFRLSMFLKYVLKFLQNIGLIVLILNMYAS